LDWKGLLEIRSDYIHRIPEYKILARFISECSGGLSKVHSIKTRIKDPWHLVRKIIWKKASNPELRIEMDNYCELITDLIGIRVLHLFKDDWQKIHREIMDKWPMKEKPVANIRKGDSDRTIELYKELGLEIKEHQYGYRSVHYQILQPHHRRQFTAEIQVRTLFEEAWSEIDHRYRYPASDIDETMAEYLVLFNRLAGSADEMGSFIRNLKTLVDRRKAKLGDSPVTRTKEIDLGELTKTTGRLLE